MNPKIVEWSHFSWSPASIAATRVADAAGALYSATSAVSQSVAEGSLALAAFKFVNPQGGTPASVPVQLMDAASLSLSMVGLADEDLLHGGQLFAYALDAQGEVIGGVGINTVYPADGQGAATTYLQPAGGLPQTSGTIEFGDHVTSPDTLGTGVYGLLLVAPIAVDTVIEHGDRLLFQLANHGQSAFTQSYYLEKSVVIVDRYTAATRPKLVVASDTGVSSAVVALLKDGSTVASTNVASTLPGSVGVSTPVPAFASAANGAGQAPFEGQWAVAKFSVMNAAGSSLFQANGVHGLEYTTDLRVSYQGLGVDDASAESFQAFAVDVNGAVLGQAALPIDNGTVSLPAGTSHLVLALRTLQDAQAERNEQVVFQVNKVDADAFTASHHVEQRVAIKDYRHTFHVSDSGTFAGTDTADEFVVSAGGSHVFNGTDYAYATIEGYGEGDRLKVDITSLSTPWPHAGVTTVTDVTNPRLSVQNLGTLDLAEAYLVLGLHALDGSKCQRGALYLLGAHDDADPNTVHTFVVIDSNSDGYLTTHTSTHADVVIKLAGVSPNTFDDTDFLLV